MPDDRPYLSVDRDDLFRVAELLASFPVPWFLCGGWAIDTFLGRVTRVHEDIEIGIRRDDQGSIHERFPDWTILKIVSGPEGGDLVPWERGDRLELPIHQIVMQHGDFQPPEFEFFLNDVIDGEWRFRRAPSIRRPFDGMVTETAWRIPTVAPEVQLLYKSTYHRPKDDQDFEAVRTTLDANRCAWLREALTVYRPGDPWLDRL